MVMLFPYALSQPYVAWRRDFPIGGSGTLVACVSGGYGF